MNAPMSCTTKIDAVMTTAGEGGLHLTTAETTAGKVAGATAMTTFVFQVRNVPAALYKAMGGFATNGVNMTKLESYQRGGTFAATEFFCDIEGRPGEPHVDRALEELQFHTKSMRLLGSYGRARERG